MGGGHFLEGVKFSYTFTKIFQKVIISLHPSLLGIPSSYISTYDDLSILTARTQKWRFQISNQNTMLCSYCSASGPTFTAMSTAISTTISPPLSPVWNGGHPPILTHQKKSLLKIIPVYFFGKGACPNYASVQIITLLYTFYRIRHVRINAYERFWRIS